MVNHYETHHLGEYFLTFPSIVAKQIQAAKSGLAETLPRNCRITSKKDSWKMSQTIDERNPNTTTCDVFEATKTGFWIFFIKQYQYPD